MNGIDVARRFMDAMYENVSFQQQDHDKATSPLPLGGGNPEWTVASMMFVVLKIVLVFLLAKLILTVLSQTIFKATEHSIQTVPDDHDGETKKRRIVTIHSIGQSIAQYIVWTGAILLGLSLLGFDMKALIAVAGVSGILVAVGSQVILRDFFTGTFLIMENQYSVGEQVTIDNVEGIVESVELRFTRLRTFGGETVSIPHGSITKVVNHSRSAKRVWIHSNITYESDQETALKVLRTVCANFEKHPGVLGGPEVLGVSDTTDTGIKLTVFCETQPLEQWRIQRAIRLEIVRQFKENGILFSTIVPGGGPGTPLGSIAPAVVASSASLSASGANVQGMDTGSHNFARRSVSPSRNWVGGGGTTHQP
jgi:moderate conductance mechanosensitive channel